MLTTGKGDARSRPEKRSDPQVAGNDKGKRMLQDPLNHAGHARAL